MSNQLYQWLVIMHFVIGVNSVYLCTNIAEIFDFKDKHCSCTPCPVLSTVNTYYLYLHVFLYFSFIPSLLSDIEWSLRDSGVWSERLGGRCFRGGPSVDREQGAWFPPWRGERGVLRAQVRWKTRESLCLSKVRFKGILISYFSRLGSPRPLLRGTRPPYG